MLENVSIVKNKQRIRHIKLLNKASLNNYVRTKGWDWVAQGEPNNPALVSVECEVSDVQDEEIIHHKCYK